MDADRVVIRLNSLISFAGVLTQALEVEGKKTYVLKPSDNSDVTIHIPVMEIDTIFCIDGKSIKGEEIYEFRNV